MKPSSVVLFDAGHTLWHARGPIEVLYDGLAAAGLGRSREQVRQAYEVASQTASFESAGFETSGQATDQATLDEFFRQFDRRLLAALGLGAQSEALLPDTVRWFVKEAELYPETKAVLTELGHRGYRMAIVSNGAYQSRDAQTLGIFEHFRVIVGSAYVGYKKPMPHIFQLALSALQVSPSQAMMVGDDLELDVKGAELAGITAVHLNRGETPSPAMLSAKDLWGVLEILERFQERASR